jgi:2-polyprenyl-6-hydroxyphenyl methylase/3-demethylubiquinone-9 3-methyltransferase
MPVARARTSSFGSRRCNGRTSTVSRNTICLWYDGTALDAAQFYAQTFPDSAVGRVMRAPGDYPSGKQGDVLTVEFTVLGIPCLGLNGGPAFRHSEAFSFQVATDDQAETDRYWNAIVGNGGQESECGWCKDKWGLSWQITPRALTSAITDPDPAVARRAFEAMMTMRKIDVAAIEAARRLRHPLQVRVKRCTASRPSCCTRSASNRRRRSVPTNSPTRCRPGATATSRRSSARWPSTRART